MTRTSRYGRRHLKGSPLEDWIADALTKQSEPHPFEPGRDGGCGACGLDKSTPAHTVTTTAAPPAPTAGSTP